MHRRRLGTCLVAAGVVALSTTSAWSAVQVDSGTITTVAGTGSGAVGPGADGESATAAAIDHPRGLAIVGGGGFLLAEPFRNTVRRASSDGRIFRAAGTGERGYSGDGGPAVQARLDLVHGVALAGDGGFFLADTGNNRIRRVWPDGTITTVAGTGVPGFSGDGGPAAAARINAPRGLAALPDGGLLIPDSSNHRIRRVWPSGTITTVAGTGVPGFAGDGGPATGAKLDLPFGVAPLADGGFLVVDAANHRIRRIWPKGTITTVAGSGVPGFGGDGGPAVSAGLNSPHAVAALPGHGFLIADTVNHRIRRVWPDGTITTVVGTGVPGFSGDGVDPRETELNLPKALAVLTDVSGFLVADAANNRVRLVRFPRDLPPRIVAGSLRRVPNGQTTRYVFRLRACDDSRASLVAEIRVSVRGAGTETTSSLQRRLASTAGGCRPYRVSWRLAGPPLPPSRVIAHVRVRDANGAWSNAVDGRA